jgi:hypothetical protein
MMDKKFKEWLKKSEKEFADLNIKVIGLTETDNDNDTSNITVAHESSTHIGQISVQSTGTCTIEVISIATEEMAFHIYCLAKMGIDFDLLLGNYVAYMKI